MKSIRTALSKVRRFVSLHPTGAALTLICLFSFAANSPLLFGSFLHFDDGQQIFENLRVKDFSWATFADALFTNYTGKGSAPSFAVSVLNWAVTPSYVGFAAVNLICFTGVIVLFYRFTALFIGAGSGRLLATLLFSVHSLNVDALGWMSSRCHIMGATFILCAFIFWQKYQDDISKSKRLLWYLLAILSAAVAVWNKGIFLVVPGLLFFYDLYRCRRFDVLFFIDKLPIAAIAFLPLLYTPLKMGAGSLNRPGIGSTLYNTLINDAGLILEYLYHLAVPGPTAVSIDVYPVKTIFEVSDMSSLVCLRMPPIFNIALLTSLFCVSLILFIRYKRRLSFFLFILILVALAPVMNIPPRWVDFAFRFELMPLFFFCVGAGAAAAYVGSHVNRRARFGLLPLVAALVLGHAAMSFRQARYWDEELKYWLACTDNFPDSIVCRGKAAWLLESSGKLEMAAVHLKAVHEYSMHHLPNRVRPSAKRVAELYRRMNHKEDALFYYRRSLFTDPLNGKERKQVQEALRALEKQGK